MPLSMHFHNPVGEDFAVTVCGDWHPLSVKVVRVFLGGGGFGTHKMPQKGHQ